MHEARQPSSWLIFDVGQKRPMKRLTAISLSLLVIATLAALYFSLRNGDVPNASAAHSPSPSPSKGDASASKQYSAAEDELLRLREENERLKAALSAAAAAHTDTPTSKVLALREVIAKLPEQTIPEFALLTEDDWYAAVEGPLTDTDDYRIALSKLRGRAERRFALSAQPALQAYIAAHGVFPATLSDLKPHLAPVVQDAMLDRYRIAAASDLRNIRMGGDFIVTQRAQIDSEYDAVIGIGPNGFGTLTRSTQDTQVLDPVMKAYAKANPNNPGFSPMQLYPYATTPEQRAAVERLERRVIRR